MPESTKDQFRSRLRSWLPHYCHRFGALPEKYLALDIETFGFAYTDPIWQIGHALVIDGELVEQANTVLDPRLTQPPGWDCDAAIAKLRDSMARNDAACHLTAEALDTGIHPLEAYEALSALLDTAMTRGYVVVTHNGLKFDIPRIENWLRVFNQAPIAWRDNSRLDTHALVKACQLGHDCVPQSRDTLESWGQRVVKAYAKGIPSSLTWCDEMLEISEQYNLDPSLAHTAAHDAAVTHYLISECKKLVT